MTERIAFIVFASTASALLNPIVIIVAGLALAVVILVTALFLFRNSGKKKGAKSADKAGAASDWQRMQQQAGAPGAWNQPGGGAPADWAQQQQQPGAWGAQNPAQQQQPGAWGAQNPAQQQQPGTWGAQNPAQPQQPGTWGAQNPAQPQPGAWGAQNPAQQQPATWGAQTASPQQPAANAWGAQNPAQPQQPAAWGAQNPAQPQQPSEWGAAPPNSPPAGTGMDGGQQSWGSDATFMPQKSAQSQDPWAQQQAAPQQGAQVWGSPGATGGSAPLQQQAPTAYGGSGSGQSWPQTGQPKPGNDPWAQPAPAQPPAWGQQGPGPAQGQGFGAPGSQPDAAPLFGASDNDRTMLRPSGPQGSLGTVRVEEGKEPGRVYEVRKEELSIGRSRESDIFLEDLAVSRLHAKILSLGSGNYALKDEGSANGTKVNGQLVNKYQTYPLQEGDKIQLGQTVLVFARR
jgi:FHA domain